MHWAISRKTAAEIISSRADSAKPNRGLSAWKNSPHGRIRKDDVAVAKNYLDERELNALNRIVTMYLDYAELQATNRVVMRMKDWIKRMDAFLRFNERDVLDNPGKVSAEIAKAFAEKEYEKYSVIQDRLLESDFDRAVKQIERKDTGS